MRVIGTLTNERHARTLGEYLYVQGIRNEVEAEAGAWTIWVHDEDQLDQARIMLERFVKHPESPEFRGKAPVAAALQEQEAKEQAEYEERFRDRSQVFAKTSPYGAGLLTMLLIATCVVVAIWTGLGHNREAMRLLFISKYAAHAAHTPLLAEVRQGEVWRLLTPIFLHLSPLHILFNMMWLFQLGSMIEARQSSWHLAGLVLGTALLSNCAEYYWSQPNFGGMSGVVYGLFGYVWIRGKFDPASGLFMDRANTLMMIAWFFICAVGLVGNVANYAHGGGLIAGAAWGYLSAVWPRR